MAIFAHCHLGQSNLRIAVTSAVILISSFIARVTQGRIPRECTYGYNIVRMTMVSLHPFAVS